MTKKIDKYANIAATSLFAPREGLIVPHVRKDSDKKLYMTGTDEWSDIFNTKVDPKEDVEKQLIDLREKYTAFTEDFCPETHNYRLHTEFNSFQWRIATAEDKKNFLGTIAGEGNWDLVTIPHYQGPIGKAETVYRKEFYVDILPQKDQSAFLCFDGVDYIANVYLNGRCIGHHEGFFAPFEFECSETLLQGKNILVVCVENDYVHMGNSQVFSGEEFTGDKIYAATGPGYDEPEVGWHHCPAGMGIMQPVYLEYRARTFISDIFVRPLCDENKAEVRVEVFNVDVIPVDARIRVKIYGKNFSEVVTEAVEYNPVTLREAPLGDTVEDANSIKTALQLYSEKGVNFYHIPIDMGSFRWWSPSEPWLYKAIVQLVLNGNVIDERNCTFGMRSFTMDTTSEMKGMMYLNGKKIRLRGANTMGFEQQDVMNGKLDQLFDDLLLVKACNINFLRITQRPVQSIILDYCDALGIMVQTDFPLFGALRKNTYAEAVKQVGEMERLVRRHPSAIVDTYINENAPNGRNKPHRNMSREELMSFFEAADHIVRFWNPDRVIKHIEGDFDPPTSLNTLTDNHAYTFWYNGQGLDAGEFIKGDWVPVKPGWYYACGEYGGEGLDPKDLMYRHLPKSWLPQTKEEEYNWTPDRITAAQTGFVHYCFFETPHTVEDWVKEGQQLQAEGLRIMTESFRRNADMVSFAVFYFIDEWPTGWMKALVDCERTPKKAFYEYRDMLSPVFVSLRTDRFSYFTGEEIKIELWVSNDMPEKIENAKLVYQAVLPNGSILSGNDTTTLSECGVDYIGEICIPAGNTEGRLTLEAAILDKENNVIHRASKEYSIFKSEPYTAKVALLSREGVAEDLVNEMKIDLVSLDEATCILVDDYDLYMNQKDYIDGLIRDGKHVIFYRLPQGKYNIVGMDVEVKNCSMGAMHFVSRDTGHELVTGFGPKDFRWWYGSSKDQVTSILESTIKHNGMTPVLLSGNTDDDGKWIQTMAVAEKRIEKGIVTVCQLKLDDHTCFNPIANNFASRMLSEQ